MHLVKLHGGVEPYLRGRAHDGHRTVGQVDRISDVDTLQKNLLSAAGNRTPIPWPATPQPSHCTDRTVLAPAIVGFMDVELVTTSHSDIY
jgi:hypothetical protein